MRTYINFEIELLSNTCCGDGMGNGSDVDMSVYTDNYGLPEIPGRRIKGLLREKAMLLAEHGACTKEAVTALFGKDGGVAARIMVDNARLENADAIIKAVQGYVQQEVSDVFIEKRIRTAVNADGTVKSASLRTMETVIRGTVFSAEIIVTDTQEGDIAILEKALKLLRGIGHSKTRGLGEVACRITDVRTEQMPVVTYEKSGARYRVDYTLECLQDVVLMAGSPVQTPEYIGGSALQGAFARVFASYDYFDTLFFDDVYFSNAYIAAPERFFSPMPISMKAKKNDDSGFYNEADGFAYEPGVQYVRAKGYYSMRPDVCAVAEPLCGTEYHIRKKEQLLYTYTKLERGQHFRGIMEGSLSALHAMEQAVLAMGGVMKIGASGTAQYGKCKITLSQPYTVEDFSVTQGETVIVECVSDMIVCDAMGHNSVQKEVLLATLKEALHFEAAEVFAGTDVTGGYNAKWGMPKQRMEVFSMGTTIVMKNCSACNLPKSFFVGLRNSEGYGEVILRKPQSAARKAETVVVRSLAEGMSESHEIAEKIEKKRLENSVRLQGAKDGAIAYRKYTGLSDSAAMRLLSAYQALVKNGIPETLVEDYGAFIRSLSANQELYALAKEILTKFKRFESTDANLFSIYIKHFIIRYKECGQVKKKGAKA